MFYNQPNTFPQYPKQPIMPVGKHPNVIYSSTTSSLSSVSLLCFSCLSTSASFLRLAAFLSASANFFQQLITHFKLLVSWFSRVRKVHFLQLSFSTSFANWSSSSTEFSESPISSDGDSPSATLLEIFAKYFPVSIPR